MWQFGNKVQGDEDGARGVHLFAAYLLVAEDRLKAVLLEGWARDEDDPILALSLESVVPEELMKERMVYEAIYC